MLRLAYALVAAAFAPPPSRASTHLSKAHLSRASKFMNAPFSQEELERALHSFQALCPDHDWSALKGLYADTLHKKYNDWEETEASAASLESIIGGRSTSVAPMQLQQARLRALLSAGGSLA